MITFKLEGSTTRTNSFLTKMRSPESYLYSDLAALAQRGVNALAAATPTDTGATAAAWGYEIVIKGSEVQIYWINTNTNGEAHIAILLQYGHGTGTGGYVSGRDYINPALAPIFDEIANDVWRKVTSA